MVCAQCGYILSSFDTSCPRCVGARPQPVAQPQPAPAPIAPPAPAMPPASILWHYSINGQQFGPVPQDQMPGLVSQGYINGQTLVWRQGLTQWVPAGGSEL